MSRVKKAIRSLERARKALHAVPSGPAWRLSPTGKHYLARGGFHAYVDDWRAPVDGIDMYRWELLSGDDFVARGHGRTIEEAKALVLDRIDAETAALGTV